MSSSQGHTRRTATEFDIVRDLLDHELVDAEGLPCGMVDDVVLEGEAGGPLRIVALLIGPGAWMPRMPGWIAGLARHVLSPSCIRVPWSAVVRIAERIELNSKASELGLGRVDRRVARWVARIPGARHAPK